MEIFNKEYLKDIIEHSKQSLNQTFCFHKENFSKFDTVNSFLIDKVLKNDRTNILPKIPSCIPFQYINKSGEVYPDTSFDPLLIVVNDFNTAKEYIIGKGIPIDTITFIGDTKYQQSISAISKAYRQQKFNRCIFIGTQDIETGEHFEALKWNWTLPEIKFFNQQKYQNLTPEIISNAELSEATLRFTNFIAETEKRYENLISLKRLLKFIRRIYPITAIGNENRIRERANEICVSFESEAEEVFQDEYYNIDTDYQEDLEQLKSITKNIIDLIKNANAKDNWFKNAADIDYIVVPKSIKKHYEKEIQNCFDNQQSTKEIASNISMSKAFIKNRLREIGNNLAEYKLERRARGVQIYAPNSRSCMISPVERDIIESLRNAGENPIHK